MYGCPFPLEVCLRHCVQGGCNSLEPFAELLIKSTQSNELWNFMNRSRKVYRVFSTVFLLCLSCCLLLV